MKSASCQRLRWEALAWLDVLRSMQPLLPIIKTALNRLQPPPKHAQSSLLLFLLLPLSLTYSLFQQIEQEICLFSTSLAFSLNSNLFRAFLFHLKIQSWCGSTWAPLMTTWADSGMNKTKLKYKRWWWTDYNWQKMDLLTIFCNLLLLCFDPSAATSLITGKVHTKHTETAQRHELLVQLWIYLWFPHGMPSWLYAGCLALEADIFEARGRQHTPLINALTTTTTFIKVK